MGARSLLGWGSITNHSSRITATTKCSCLWGKTCFEACEGWQHGVRRLLPRMLAVLEQHGRHQEAQDLRAKAERLLGPMPARGAAPGPVGTRPRSLPGRCPSCGAPLKPDQVNWLGPQSAECPYCGTLVCGA